MDENIPRSDALQAARKRLDFERDEVIEERLEWATDSLAEAYRIGAEEAQGVVAMRLERLKREGDG